MLCFRNMNLGLVILSALLLLCSGAVNKDGNAANKFPTEKVNASESVIKAAKWILSERRSDYTWGAFTPRAIVALSFAEDVFPLPKKEWDRMVKQLNIQLSLELGKDGGTKTLGPSRLALFANALHATCQDPRNFHGVDLIQDLRSTTDSILILKKGNITLPAVYLSLCFAGESKHEDFRELAMMYHDHRDKPDLRALELMGMDCISHQRQFQGYLPHYHGNLHNFAEHYVFFSRRADVYTKALCIQALNSNKTVDVSSLVSLQKSNGSFGSLLATYYAIPALLNKNLLALKKKQCVANKLARVTEAPLPNSSDKSPKVYYSIWIGEGVDMDTHTITVSNSANNSLFDVMEVAEKRNPIFKFSTDETNTGKRVYSMAGQPNDVERELYWTLYLSKDGAKGPDAKRLVSREIDLGVDRIFPAPDDHFVFWFKRH